MKTKANSQIKGKFGDVYGQVFEILRKDPTITILFALLALIEFLALACLFLSHSAPFSYIFGPIIQTFYSDKFLHYPANFLLLPKIFNHAHLVITSLIGVVITGLVIKKIEVYCRSGENVTMFQVGRVVFKRYLAILAAWLISYAVFRIVFAYVLPYFTSNVFIFMLASFVVGLIIQSLVVFMLPAILVMDVGLFKGLADGLLFGVKNFPMAALIISVPMLFIVALSYVKMLTPVLVGIYPELVLGVLILGIIVMTVVDLMITSSATVLYLKARD